MRRRSRSHFLSRLSPTGQRRLFGLGLFGGAAVVVYWCLFSDGLPIIWGPSASAAEIAAGQELFEHEWAVNDPLAHGDGLGPVFNAKSCAACHFQGGLGGSGTNQHNATTFEIHARPGDPEFHSGNLHNFSVEGTPKESLTALRAMYPVIPGRTIRSGSPECPTTRIIPDFDPVRTQTVQTTALFGAGWIDLISDKAIVRNARKRGAAAAVREFQLEFDNLSVGRVRTVAGGVGKFGWKAQFATLNEFVAAACANELGLGTPSAEQAKPLASPNWPAAPDLDRKQFRSLVSFVKTLPKPIEVTPYSAAAQDEARHGKELFGTLGCAICHVPDLGGVTGVYSDFLLYTLDDPPPPGSVGEYGAPPPPELKLPDRPDDDPKPSEWKTPPLWGVADSPPYLHDGTAATLPEAILRHRGDAKSVTEKFKKLSAADQAAVVAFLTTLKAPPTAPSLRDLSVTRLAKK